MKRSPAPRCQRAPLRSAFTLLELAVVLGVIAGLLVLVSSGIARTQCSTQTSRCLNNLRQLMLAWQMYAEDNLGRLPVSLSNLTPNPARSWATGWLDWTTSSDNTNTAYLVDERYAQLARYVNRATDLFQCPADRYLSSAQRRLGWTRRARSYSANMNLGQTNLSSGAPYKQIVKNSEFFYPAAADTWVFAEEHPDSINDSGFFNPRPAWVDFPAIHHDGSGVFAMADGHTEAHQWSGSLTNMPLQIPSGLLPTLGRAGDPDVHWVSWRAGRLSTTSY